MQTRQLGSQGPTVSRLGLSDFYGLEIVHRTIEMGVTFIDTADMYRPFTNEELVGQALLEGCREQVALPMRFGNQRSSDGRFIRINGTPEYVREAGASLRRSKVDRIVL